MQLRIVIFGATGNVGRRIVGEALARGHDVTAVARDPDRLGALPASAKAIPADVGSASQVAAFGAQHDVVINATRPPTAPGGAATALTRALLDGLARHDARLLIAGGAATLTVPGTNGATVLEDTRYLPAELRHIGRASADQHAACSGERRIDWAYLSPPAQLIAGERTGKYRLGRDELLVDVQGRSTISYEDLAVAVIDEVEEPRHHQLRFTVAY